MRGEVYRLRFAICVPAISLCLGAQAATRTVDDGAARRDPSAVEVGVRDAGDAADLAGNPHLDLAHTGRAGDSCVFCHTPAGPAPSGVEVGSTPSRDVSDDAPSLLGGAAGLARPSPGQPGAQTLLCLSCHETYAEVPGREVLVAASNISGLGPLFARAPRSSGLRTQHPVAVSYRTSATRLKPLGYAKAQGLTFYGPGRDRIECTTCHDPHRNRGGAYLRRDNRRSRLCLACHDK